MKQKLPILLFLLLASFVVHAQNDKLINDSFTNSSKFLFNKYINDDIKLKNGELTKTEINYNLFFQQIWYKDNSQYFVLKKMDKVEYLESENYKFLIVNKSIYQIIAHSSKYKILKSQEIDLETLNKSNGPYGTGTVGGSAKSLSSYITQSSGINNIKSNSDLEFDVITKYYISDNYDNIYNLSKRKIYRLFENKEESIKKYLKQNKISLKNENDIIELFKYITSL